MVWHTYGTPFTEAQSFALWTNRSSGKHGFLSCRSWSILCRPFSAWGAFGKRRGVILSQSRSDIDRHVPEVEMTPHEITEGHGGQYRIATGKESHHGVCRKRPRL